MGFNTGGDKYDAKSDLKTLSEKELFALRNKFANYCAMPGTVNQMYFNFLSLIELEIASRIGRK